MRHAQEQTETRRKEGVSESSRLGPRNAQPGRRRNRQNTSPPASRPHVGQLTRAGRSGCAAAMHTVGGLHCTPSHPRWSSARGSQARRYRIWDIWEARCDIFREKIQPRIATFGRVCRPGFSLRRAEPRMRQDSTMAKSPPGQLPCLPVRLVQKDTLWQCQPRRTSTRPRSTLPLPPSPWALWQPKPRAKHEAAPPSLIKYWCAPGRKRWRQISR